MEERGTKRKHEEVDTREEGTQVDVEVESKKKIRCIEYNLKDNGCTECLFPQNLAGHLLSKHK